MVFEELEQYESTLASEFRSGITSLLTPLKNVAFEEVLLQRRVFSRDYFERFYNRAIEALCNEAVKEIVRGLIREEYGRDTTHREDAVHDLKMIGIPLDRILRTRTTVQTQQSIAAMLELVQYEGQPDYDLQTTTALRFGGEILAGVEHTVLFSGLNTRCGLSQENSRYFWWHAVEDAKRVPFGQEGASHADRFGKLLAELVHEENDVCTVKKVMDKCYQVRTSFYEQFSIL